MTPDPGNIFPAASLRLDFFEVGGGGPFARICWRPGASKSATCWAHWLGIACFVACPDRNLHPDEPRLKTHCPRTKFQQGMFPDGRSGSFVSDMFNTVRISRRFTRPSVAEGRGASL